MASKNGGVKRHELVIDRSSGQAESSKKRRTEALQQQDHDAWFGMFARLCKRKNELKAGIVIIDGDPELTTWVCVQHVARYEQSLSAYRKSLLESVGLFAPSGNTPGPSQDKSNASPKPQSKANKRKGVKPSEQAWNAMYEKLLRYKEEHGNCEVPKAYKNDPKLGNWVGTQRQAYKKNILPDDWKEKLESIGFAWVSQQSLKCETFDDMYKKLVQYKEEYGNCNVPNKYRNDPKLGGWVGKQRKLYKRSKLPPERVMALDSIGFDWGTHRINESFEVMYDRLVAYRMVYGSCDVPHWYNPKLAKFVYTQRRAESKGELLPDRVKKLDAIGFVWVEPRFKTFQARTTASTRKKGRGAPPKEDTWNVMYKKFRDCEVSRGLNNDPKLAAWVSNQRTQYKKGLLANSRIKKLESIGFVGSTRNKEPFESMYERLVAFKNEHGHCNVPHNYKEDPKLAIWVMGQRRKYKKNSIASDHKEKLESIGFVWRLIVAFDAMLERLVAYKEEHGNCNVPQDYAQDPELGLWVKSQRTLYKIGCLSSENVKKLDSIGFVWTL